jgi:O-methyltransferase
MISKKIYHWLSGMLASRNLHIIKSLPYLHRNRRINLDRLDYIRLSCMELAAHEIYTKQIKGNVAELGVYKGAFAKDINAAFSDRTLYLFDTFEGFDKKDIDTEVAKGFSDGKQDFSDTSAEYVLSRMPHRDKCVVRKGFFPSTAAGLEDDFVFVSIDTDLYEPIYAGLQYFYPRLASGGYIFIHDFNNDEYKGAPQAVKTFCAEHRIAYTPIADTGGSVIIAKGG